MIDELISACFSEFCEIAGDSPCGCDACPYGRTNDDCYAIYEHDKLTTLEKKGITPLKWIPVSERLPEKDVKVLTFGVYGFSVNYRDRFSRKWRGVNGKPQWITHWMPLPEPPKEEK
jgi:hypothetical protein